MSAGHYTAVLEVSKTVPPTPAPSSGYTDRRHSSVPATPSAERKVVEVARIVIRANSLEALVGKVGAHAALIDEGGEA